MTLAAKQLSQVWVNEDAFATVLLILLMDQYGLEATEWSAETILMQIEEDFGVAVPKPNLDKLMVAIDLLTSDSFYKSLPDFVNWCNVLAGDGYDPTEWDPADAAECAWGITEALLIEPPDEENPFTDEILSYIGAVLDAEGIMNPPDVLRIALRDREDITGTVSGEFSDDPELFGAIYGFEASKTQEINRYVKANLMAVAQQLDALQLSEGQTKGVVERMLRSVPGEATTNGESG